MPISTKLDSILTGLRSIRSAIIAKGGVVPNGTALSEWGNKISALETRMHFTGETVVSGAASENLVKGDTVVRKWYPGLPFQTRLLPLGFTLDSLPIYSIQYNPNGRHLALAKGYPGGVKIFKYVGEVYTEIATLCDGSATVSMQYAPDGSYLIVITGTSPQFRCFSIVGDVYTLVTAQGSVITSPEAVAIDRTSQYVVLRGDASHASPCFKKVGNGFVRVDSLCAVGQQSRLLCFSSASDHIVSISSDDKTFKLFKRTGDTFVCIDTRSHLENFKTGFFTSNGSQLILMYTAWPYVVRYKLEGDVLTLMTSDAAGEMPPYGGGVDPTGSYFATVSATAPYVFINKLVGDANIKLASTVYSVPAPASSNKYFPIAFSPDGKHLACLLAASPYLVIHDIAGVGLVLSKTTEAFSAVAGVADLGYVLEPIAQGETGEMVSIVRNTNLYPQ